MAYHSEQFAERSAGTHKLPLRSAALGAAGVALVLGHGTTMLEKSRRSKEPDIQIHEHPGGQATFVLPGCRTDGRQIADLLDPHLSRFGTTAFTAYPGNGFSLDAIGRGLVRAREKTGKERTNIYAISMGGMVLSRLGADASFRREFGPIDKLVLDSSPARYEDVKPKMQRLLSAAQVSRYSFTMGKLTPHVLARLERDELDMHEAGLDAALIQHHFDSSAKTPLYTIASQGSFMRRQRGLPIGTLGGWARDIYYVRSREDSVIDTASSLQTYSEMFDQAVIDVVDEQRPPSSHAVGPEYPSFIAELYENESLLAA